MAYVGLNPQTQLLNTSTQTFSGNSVNYQFTLGRSVASASDLDVMIDQTLQRPFTDYEAENTTLLFQTPPASGTNNITVTYRAGALNSLNLTANAFGAGTVGAPSVYSVAANNTGIYWPTATDVAITVAGSNTIVISGNTSSSSNTTGALQVSGGIGATGNINTSGIVKITNTTNSSNISTGALVVGGSIGVAGNVTVGQNITCVGDFTVNGTFTTTGTDSLDVTDPFIFLANANPGDTYDSGVVSQFFDGSANRYTGYFRDITDGKYKLFGNLTVKPTTTVDTADASFKYQDLILANLSATGNVSGTYILGNGSQLTGILTTVSNVTNGTSGLFVPALNGNVIVNVGGATITTVSSSIGLAVTGNVNATTGMSAAGNIVGGNITTAGIASATGNITSAGNVSGGNILTGGLISAAGSITSGTHNITGALSASGNVTGGNVNTGGLVSATGNVTGGNIRTSGLVSAAGVVYSDSISATNGINAGAGIASGTDITAGNDVSATGAVNAGTTISAAGNITGSFFLGNGRFLSGIDSTGISSGTSNVKIVAANANATISIGGTANVVVVATTGQYTTGLISASGNVTGGNLTTGGQVSATGNITGGNIMGGANVNATTHTGTTVSVSGAVTGGSIATAGTVSATGNVTGGNIITSAAVSAGGAISATGVITGGSFTTNGGITMGGTFSATGNVTGGNINTAGIISSTGNSVHGTANVLAGNAIITSLVQGTTLSASGNIIGGNLNATGLSLSGNVVSGLSMITNITTTANITGGNISTAGNLAAPTAAADTNTTQVATTAFVIAQASSTTPAVIAATGSVGTSLKYARADHTHEGVTSVTASTGISTSAADGAITLTNTGVTSAVAGTGVGVSGATGAVTISIGQAVGTGNSPTFAGITLPSITKSGTNGVGDIGAAGSTFATVYATTFSGISTQAKYADLAENYSADAEYEPGTILVFGGNNEVTIASSEADARVAGVVSTNPAHLMNSYLESEYVVALALTGRVPAKVVGSVRKGDLMVTAENGHARACATPAMGTVIGKALQDFNGESGTIEIVVGRL